MPPYLLEEVVVDQWIARASDVALAARAMQGDAVCFDELARRYRPAAFATAVRLVGDPDLAADVAQEALVQAFLAIESLRAPMAFGPWLRRMVERIAARQGAHVRRRKTNECPLGDDPPAVAASDGEPSLIALRREHSDAVWSAVRSLEPDDAEVVVMRYLAGATVEAVAHYLGLSRDGAKYRLRGATVRLRSALRGYVEDQTDEGRPTDGRERNGTCGWRTARGA